MTDPASSKYHELKMFFCVPRQLKDFQAMQNIKILIQVSKDARQCLKNGFLLFSFRQPYFKKGIIGSHDI